MISIDTNILLYAQDSSCPEYPAAIQFLRRHADDPDIALCELVFVELYVLLRNPVVLSTPLSAADAVEVVQAFRANRRWSIIETAEGVMTDVWQMARRADFPRRRIFDARLAITLRRSGVRAFATHNVDDFREYGFERVWDPIVEGS
jgi:toxin-antitoxin system PIN domain toxin